MKIVKIREEQPWLPPKPHGCSLFSLQKEATTMSSDFMADVCIDIKFS
jgi:hypothetical protein